MSAGGRSRRTPVLLIGGTLVAVLLLGFVLMPGGDSGQNATKGLIAKLADEGRDRIHPRTVLSGPAESGNAWDEYSVAIRDVEAGPAIEPVRPFVNRDRGADAAKAREIVSAHANALHHLHLGTLRAEGQLPLEWDRGGLQKTPSLLSIRMLALLASAQARLWVESGRSRDAAALLVDVSVFAQDAGTNGFLLPHLIGLATNSTAYDEMRHLLLSGTLSRADLARLSGELKTLDREFPRLGPVLLNDALFDGMFSIEVYSAEPSSPRELWNRSRSAGWTHGFSGRRMADAAIRERADIARRAFNVDEMPYAESQKLVAAIQAQVTASPNELVRASGDMSKIGRAHREALAHLRLIRSAVSYLATGQVPALSDPFGVTLFHVVDGDKIRIWSLGSDGVNQNGKGDWNLSPASAGDMVIEIPR